MINHSAAGLLLLLAGTSAALAQATPPAPPAPPATPTATTTAESPRNGDARRVAFPQYPAISPDNQVIVFSWAGDLWSVPVQGGSASRLTVHPADERRALFSPDGKALAFESDRDGARNLYLMSLRREGSDLLGGPVRRLTTSDRPQNLASWAPDAQSILFGASDTTIFRMGRMFRVPIAGGSAAAGTGGATGGPVARLTEAFGSLPRITPDGSAIIFQRGSAPPERTAYRGSGQWDLWRLSLTDNTFSRLTIDPASDYDAWPAAGGSVVFVSSRDGQNNLFRLPAAAVPGAFAAQPQQLTTFKPAPGELTIGHGVRDLALSQDGSTAVFCVWDTIYRLDLTSPNAKPEPVTVVASGDEASGDLQRISVDREISETALSPDGKSIAVVARGDIFIRQTTEGYPTRRVTASAGRERDLAWSPDGRVLYFSSDDPGLSAGGGGGTGADALGKYAIYAASVSLSREDLTVTPPKRPSAGPVDKKDDPAAKPTDPKTEPTKVDPAKPDPDPKPDPNADPKPDADGSADPAVADPKAADPKTADPKTAEPTAAEPKSDDPAKPEAAAPARAAKAPRKVDFGKRWQDALRFSIAPVVVLPDADARRAVPSPDGRLLVYTRGLGDTVLLDLKDNADRTLSSSWDDAEVVWAGDSRHLVYSVSDLDFNSDIWLLDTLGDGAFKDGAKIPAPINLTRHPDNDVSPRLSADGKVLTFLSERANQDDTYEVHQVYLDKEMDAFTAYERDEYFKKAAEISGKRKPIETPAWAMAGLKLPSKPEPEPEKPEPAKADEEKKDDKPAEGAAAAPGTRSAGRPQPAQPLAFDADDAYLRIRRITTAPGSKSSLVVTPAAERIVFSMSIDGEPALVSVDPKGADRKSIQAGAVTGVSMSLTGDRVAFIRTGQAFTAPKAGGKVDAWAIDAPVVVDLPRQQTQKFLEAARTFGDRFYHPTMKGLDWPALTRRYLELAQSVRTSDEFNRLASSLFYELNASHTGASGGPQFTAPPTGMGYLGVRVRPAAGGFEVTSVTPDSPATRKGSRLNVGDVILAVDTVRFATGPAAAPTIDFDAAMLGRAGRETLVEIRRAGGTGGAERAAPDAEPTLLVITPTSSATWTGLRYREEVAQRRRQVETLSGGKLGYLHVRAMGEAEVRDFERDLYAAAHGKEGLIIDVRDNGGGSTADILLSSLTAPRHAFTAPRGVDLASVPRDAYPRDRRLIYGYTRPISVLINQNSFSNAEIFAHAIKTTGRGTVVGEATFGGVISTGGFTLIDGTSIRMPFRGWYLPDGADLENNGAKPDIRVELTPIDDVAGTEGSDPQLEAAVKEMLSRVSR